MGDSKPKICFNCTLYLLIYLKPFARKSKFRKRKGRMIQSILNDAVRTPTESALKEKGLLLCYNQFSPHYNSFREMIDELPTVAKLGYNAVWMSPLHPVSQYPKYNKKKGSLYAAVDLNRWRSDFFGTDDVKEQEALLKEYTARAKYLGLAPMFDLVLNHMGRDSEQAPNLVERGEDHALNERIRISEGDKAISTRDWFKRDAEGNIVVNGVYTDKEDGVPQPDGGKKDMWDDIAMMDYDNEEKRRQIIAHLWNPHIDKYIGELGFEGMRIDAAQKVPPEVLKSLITRAGEVSGKPPVTLAETLGEVTDEQRIGLQGCGITHVTNGSFWTPMKHAPENWNTPLSEFAAQYNEGQNGREKNRYDMRWIVRHNAQSPVHLHDNSRGGTVSLYDSHDHQSHANHWEFTNDTDREQALREAMAQATFYGDAGSVGCTGVHVANNRHRSVFIGENPPANEASTIDMSKFIRELHIIAAAQPALDINAWSERRFMEGHPELLIMITHDYDFSKPHEPKENTYLKIANTHPNVKVNLSAGEIAQLAEWSHKTVEEFQEPEKSGIYTCGDVSFPMQAKGLVEHAQTTQETRIGVR